MTTFHPLKPTERRAPLAFVLPVAMPIAFAIISLLSACAPFGKTTYPSVEVGALPDNQSQSHPDAPPTTPGGPTSPPSTNPPTTSLPTRPPFDSLADGPQKYLHPWMLQETSIVIDAYQGNSIDWKLMSTDPRVAGVIHRSSIGTVADTQYASRKNLAKENGYLWGAYHLGRAGDPIQQAQFFLKTAGSESDTLLILDLEDTSSGSMMNIPNSLKFMEYVFQTTGKIPVVYANDSVTKSLNKAMAGNALFQHSRLWYARFVQEIRDFPKGIWQSYFLWQFSSEINCSKTGACVYNVPGTKSDMDINVFYGSKAALTSQWK